MSRYQHWSSHIYHTLYIPPIPRAPEKPTQKPTEKTKQETEKGERGGRTNRRQKQLNRALAIDRGLGAAQLRDLADDADQLAGEGVEVTRRDARCFWCCHIALCCAGFGLWVVGCGSCGVGRVSSMDGWVAGKRKRFFPFFLRGFRVVSGEW